MGRFDDLFRNIENEIRQWAVKNPQRVISTTAKFILNSVLSITNIHRYEHVPPNIEDVKQITEVFLNNPTIIRAEIPELWKIIEPSIRSLMQIRSAAESTIQKPIPSTPTTTTTTTTIQKPEFEELSDESDESDNESSENIEMANPIVFISKKKQHRKPKKIVVIRTKKIIYF